jgi:general stress protein 26
MGDRKDLVSNEAIEKIRHICAGQIAMLCTYDGTHEMQSRPMATQGIDRDGTLWFFSDSESAKNLQIKDDAHVHVLYAVHSKNEYVTLKGTATVYRDQKKIDELWTPIAKTWFNGGKDDPHLTLIKVSPVAGHYWDTKHNKMVSLAKIAVGALIGKTLDDGVQGNLQP